MARPQIGGITIRRLEQRDLPAVMAIESAALPWAAHWTPESYLPGQSSDMCAWVAEQAERVAGFVLARYLGGDMELLNLAVAAEARHAGAGRALVRAALEEGASRGASQAYLEVRESNAAALEFYAALGFSTVGRRTRYYPEPAEDALILSVPLPRRV